MKLVIIPSLISWGTITVLDIKSAARINTAPKIAEIGITIRLSGPVISLTIWGIIIPIKAIIPHIETDIETKSVVSTRNTNRVLGTFNPNDDADPAFVSLTAD